VIQEEAVVLGDDAVDVPAQCLGGAAELGFAEGVEQRGARLVARQAGPVGRVEQPEEQGREVSAEPRAVGSAALAPIAAR